MVKGAGFESEMTCTHALRLLLVQVVVVLALTRLFQEAVGVELFLKQIMRFFALVDVFMIEFRAHFFRVIEHLICQIAVGG